MKTAYRGTRYDTDSAELIGWGRSCRKDGNAPDWWEAALYRQGSGEFTRFFLAGKGGWLTPWKGKERIIPLDLSDTEAFARAHLGAKAAAMVTKA